MKVLCVAEKPSISKEVSRILSGGRFSVRNTKSKFIKNYDFKFDFPGHGFCDVTMTAVAGHLRRTDFPSNCGWGKVPPGRLFELTIENTVDSGKNAIHSNIASEARTASVLMIWTDCDREGEAIGYEILQSARTTNPSLNVNNTWRSRFSHLERNHIVRAAKSPQSLNMKSVQAVELRQEVDLRVGASFTRFLTDLLKGGRLIDHVVSYGTCQFPTLGFVVDRYTRVKKFVAEKFWYIHVEVEKLAVATAFNWSQTHFFDRLYVVLLYQECLKHKKATITNVQRKPTSNYKPLPLTTVLLQKDCSTYFKLSAKQTLDAAEKLYQAGFISYPRTETDKFPGAMDMKSIISRQTQDSRWGDYANQLLLQGYKPSRNGSHDDKAHPPIHPVNFVNIDSLRDPKQQKVYEYVVRRFLACCSDDAKGFLTTVNLQWNQETFTATGLEVTERNYLEVYVYKKWQSSKQLPPFEPGEEVDLKVGEVKEGKTSPPKHMTETELIALMDANGIGTDATIAEHISKIIDREYVTKKKTGGTEVIIPTELGMGLIGGFSGIDYENNISLSKPFLRKRLEILLAEIENGSTTKDRALRENIMVYKNAFALTAQSQSTLIREFKAYQSQT